MKIVFLRICNKLHEKIRPLIGRKLIFLFLDYIFLEIPKDSLKSPRSNFNFDPFRLVSDFCNLIYNLGKLKVIINIKNERRNLSAIDHIDKFTNKGIVFICLRRSDAPIDIRTEKELLKNCRLQNKALVLVSYKKCLRNPFARLMKFL